MDFFEGNDEVVGEATSLVDVSVSARANSLLDFVLGDDFGSGVYAPALGVGW